MALSVHLNSIAGVFGPVRSSLEEIAAVGQTLSSFDQECLASTGTGRFTSPSHC